MFKTNTDDKDCVVADSITAAAVEKRQVVEAAVQASSDSYSCYYFVVSVAFLRRNCFDFPIDPS